MRSIPSYEGLMSYVRTNAAADVQTPGLGSAPCRVVYGLVVTATKLTNER
jgi:hypothetical protein